MEIEKSKEHDGCKGCMYEGEPSTGQHCQECKQNAVDRYRKATNADRIRNMTIKELAEVIMCPYDISEPFLLPICTEKTCIECTTEWLMKEGDSNE